MHLAQKRHMCGPRAAVQPGSPWCSASGAKAAAFQFRAPQDLELCCANHIQNLRFLKAQNHFRAIDGRTDVFARLADMHAGGDWGGDVVFTLGSHHSDNCKAVHTNFPIAVPKLRRLGHLSQLVNSKLPILNQVSCRSPCCIPFPVCPECAAGCSA